MILTVMVAVIGAFIATKLKWPAAPMIGALLGVSLFNVVTQVAVIPVEFKILTQMIAGIFIGCRISRSDLLQLKKMMKSIVIVLFILMGCCLLMGYGIYLISDVNLPTGLLATAPGGLVDITLISEDLGANSATVSVFQITRLFSVLSLCPLLLKNIISKKEVAGVEVVQPLTQTSSIFNLKNMILTFIVAIISGMIGKWTQLPAGTLIFSMLGCSILNMVFNRAYMPKLIRSGAQICAGALIGSGVTLSAVLELRTCLVPALCMIIFYLVLNLGLALLLKRLAHLDFVTAFFACAPGGASDMTLMSADFSANVAWVSVFQIIRSVCMIAVYPFIVMLLTVSY